MTNSARRILNLRLLGSAHSMWPPRAVWFAASLVQGDVQLQLPLSTQPCLAAVCCVQLVRALRLCSLRSGALARLPGFGWKPKGKVMSPKSLRCTHHSISGLRPTAGLQCTAVYHSASLTRFRSNTLTAKCCATMLPIRLKLAPPDATLISSLQMLKQHTVQRTQHTAQRTQHKAHNCVHTSHSTLHEARKPLKRRCRCRHATSWLRWPSDVVRYSL